MLHYISPPLQGVRDVNCEFVAFLTSIYIIATQCCLVVSGNGRAQETVAFERTRPDNYTVPYNTTIV